MHTVSISFNFIKNEQSPWLCSENCPFLKSTTIPDRNDESKDFTYHNCRLFRVPLSRYKGEPKRFTFCEILEETTRPRNSQPKENRLQSESREINGNTRDDYFNQRSNPDGRRNPPKRRER